MNSGVLCHKSEHPVIRLVDTTQHVISRVTLDRKITIRCTVVDFWAGCGLAKNTAALP